MATRTKSDEVLDLSATAAESAQATRAQDTLKKNLAHLLISAQEEQGLELDFGPDADGNERVLYFKPKVPTTAMEALLNEQNRIEALKSYISLTLLPDSRALFAELMDDLPLEALNAIVEAITEATTPFPTK